MLNKNYKKSRALSLQKLFSNPKLSNIQQILSGQIKICRCHNRAYLLIGHLADIRILNGLVATEVNEE